MRCGTDCKLLSTCFYVRKSFVEMCCFPLLVNPYVYVDFKTKKTSVFIKVLGRWKMFQRVFLSMLFDLRESEKMLLMFVWEAKWFFVTKSIHNLLSSSVFCKMGLS